MSQLPRPASGSAVQAVYAVTRDLRAREVVVIGAGGRLHRLFGQLALLGAEAHGEIEIEAQLGSAVVHVVCNERVIADVPGELVSLFALHGPAHGVVTEDPV